LEQPIYTDKANERLMNPSILNINHNLCTGWASENITGQRGFRVKFSGRPREGYKTVKIRNVIIGALCYSDDGMHPKDSPPIPVQVQEDPDFPELEGHADRGWKFDDTDESLLTPFCQNYSGLKLYVYNGFEKPDIPVAETGDECEMKEGREYIHFFSHENPEYGLDASRYRQGVTVCAEAKEGDTVELHWTKSNKRAVISTLEIIYSKVFHSSDHMAKYPCIATHNLLRANHEDAFSGDNKFLLDTRQETNISLTKSAQEHANWLKEDGNDFKHVNKRPERVNGTAINGITYCSLSGIGENLAKFTWKTSPSENEKRAIMSYAAQEWYREHVNFDMETQGKNGNELYKGQIGHFMQMARKDLGWIYVGIGFAHNDATKTSYVVAQYEKGMHDLEDKSFVLTGPAVSTGPADVTFTISVTGTKNKHEAEYAINGDQKTAWYSRTPAAESCTVEMSKSIIVTGFTLGRKIDDDYTKNCYKGLKVFAISEDDEEVEIASTPDDFVADDYIHFFNYKDSDFTDDKNENYKKDVTLCRTNKKAKKLKVQFTNSEYKSTIALFKIHYQPEPFKVRDISEKNSRFAKMLAFHEEVKLRRSILDRVDKINDADFSNKELQKLWASTDYYIKKTRKKMDFYDEGTIDYSEPQYSQDDWDNELQTVREHMNTLEAKNTGVKTDYDETFIDSMKYVIPKSLAESRFGLLYLSNMFQNMFDLLSLKVMLNRTSRNHTMLPNLTIIECLEDTTLAISTVRFKHDLYNTCAMEEAIYKKVLRVLLGFWSVREDTPMQGLTQDEWTEDAKKVLVFLRKVFDDITITEHWAEDFNDYNGDNNDMVKEWHENKENYTMPTGYPDYSSNKHTLTQDNAETMFENVSLMSKC